MPEDRYETEHMRDGSPIVHREKIVMRTGNRILFGLGGTFGAVGVIGGAISLAMFPPLAVAAAGMLGAGLLIGALPLVFGVFRTTVSREHVHVQLGPFGPRIPIAAIESVELAELRPGVYRSGFRKIGPREWEYTALVRGGVRIAWRHGDELRRAFVSSEDPPALKAAIERACAAPKVRVEPIAEEEGEALEIDRATGTKAEKSKTQD